MELTLIDFEGESVYSFDAHGNTYSVVEVINKDTIIAKGPDDEEDSFTLEDIMEQDDFIAGVTGDDIEEEE